MQGFPDKIKTFSLYFSRFAFNLFKSQSLDWGWIAVKSVWVEELMPYSVHPCR